MNILYIDTHSTKKFSIGYYNQNNLKILNGLDASLELISRIDEISCNKIDKIIFISGPGSLTGLRIGSSFAQGIALAKNIPVLCLNLWDLIFSEFPNIEVYFYTGTKKWIYKTIEKEIITIDLMKPINNWISNEPSKLNFNMKNNIVFTNLIELMHKYNHLASNNIDLLYYVSVFTTK